MHAEIGQAAQLANRLWQGGEPIVGEVQLLQGAHATDWREQLKVDDLVVVEREALE